MRITCEYCGSSIDTEKDDKCPSCGANIGTNKEMKEAMNIQKQQEKENLEQSRLYNMEKDRLLKSQESATKFVKFVKIGCSIPIILIILMMTIAFIGVLKNNNIINNKEEKTIEIIEKQVEGNLKETVSTSTYSVICDNYEEFERYSKPTSGYKYIRFHFIIENISDEEIYDNVPVRAIADGIQCERANFSDKKVLPNLNIMPGAKNDGYIGFEIPENAELIDIKYGNYITIHITMN